MTQKVRPQRVAELIRHEIAQLLSKGLKDPRIGFVSVMNVKLSPDLRYADVYVSLFGSDQERKSSLVGLQRSAGWVRHEIGKHVRMRYTPEIRFLPDDTLDQVYHLEEVFGRIHEAEAQTPMRALSFAEILEIFRERDSFLLTTHISPDGDAIGSLLGLYHLLRALGKSAVHCVMADPVPRTYAFLPGAGQIRAVSEELPETDLAVVVDAGDLDRIGAVARHIPDRRNLLIVDHHLDEGPAGAIGLIDSSFAATGEMIFELFQASETPLTRDAATCLYVAQATDTGGFRFSNTTARSHRIAAVLYDAGIEAHTLCSRVFDVVSLPKARLLQLVLERMAFGAGGRVAHSFVAPEDFEAAGARRDDIENLVNYTRNIEGVQVGVLCYAVKPDETKVSLRAAPGFNAAAFLNRFGGGGHAAAAGATLTRPLREVRDEVVHALLEAMDQNP
ncbi:MAG: 30S ribosome-binding factor RbfA [Candidatus Hydrogenedentes bacterium]|nr:30S ribosome-binding factor RbfA [Candidatus Hydrogenedentota bacterium]